MHLFKKKEVAEVKADTVPREDIVLVVKLLDRANVFCGSVPIRDVEIEFARMRAIHFAEACERVEKALVSLRTKGIMWGGKGATQIVYTKSRLLEALA